MTGIRARALALLVSTATSAGCAAGNSPAPSTPPTPPRVVQLNQGWSGREADFYNHANEGTNLAPLEFFMNLPDPARPGARFVDRIARDYGFIASRPSPANPHGLPVGFTIDERPKAFGDRAYVGITCAACHTRQMTYSGNGIAGRAPQQFVLAVHGGPGMVDIPRFMRDLYDGFFTLANDDVLAQAFANAVLGRAAAAEEVAALRAEVRAFSEPVAVTRSVLAAAGVPAADFGPGNLNALSQGYYNNIGLVAWLTKRGMMPPNNSPRPMPRFEGTVNLPPTWFAHQDTWAQWFAEIHDPGPRNWVQSISTSEVRPPKMVAAQKAGVIFSSVHFDNIAEIQRLLELLRTPKWPEDVLGPLDRARVEKGRGLYDQQCAQCHTRTVLPPNSLGIVFRARPAYDVGTDPVAYQQFAEGAAVRAAGLKQMADGITAARQAQLAATVGAETAANYMKLHSRGRPNQFGLAEDTYKDAPQATWPKSGAAYWAPPLDGIFATSPYFHNGSVRTLRDVLTPPAQRPRSFRTGSVEFDADGVGLQDEGAFVFDTTQPGKGNGGHSFGTDLADADKAALIEYLKSL